MHIYLLPWSRVQSRMDMVRKDLSEVWREGIGNRFPELNPLREALIRELGVGTTPLAPAFRRYKGRFWEELSFWALPRRVQEEIERGGVIPSPLMGLVGISDLLPTYGLDWRTTFREESLRSFWRSHLEELVRRLFEGAVLWDFLSTEDRRVIPFPENTRRVTFTYYRGNKRVINTLPHRAYTLRYILEMKVGLEDIGRINFLDYKVEEVEEKEGLIRVKMRSEGRYI